MKPLFNLPLTLFCVFTIYIVTVSASSKVKLTDVKTLTLYPNEMTTFRRTSAVPQLKCVGGSAGCSSYQPKVVQCYNRGSDGIDVQWECKADMERPYSFGKIEVVCEGYDYPDDPYILKGSCGMEYKLENDGSGGKTSGWTTGNQSGKSSGLGDFILIIVVAIMIYGIYVTCIGNQQQHQYSPTDDTDDNHRPYGNPGFGGGGGSWFRRSGPAPPGFRPEYSSGPSCGGGTGTYTSGPSSGGGGFWTGAATGGLLGYMFGSRGSGYNSGYGSSGYGGFGGSSGFGASTSGFGSSSSRSSSGFGGTRRR